MLCGAFKRISPKERVVSNHTRSLYAPAEAPLIFSKLSLENIGEGFLNGEHDYHLASCWEIHSFTWWGNGKEAAPVLGSLTSGPRSTMIWFGKIIQSTKIQAKRKICIRMQGPTSWWITLLNSGCFGTLNKSPGNQDVDSRFFFFPWEKGQQQTIQPCSITRNITGYEWHCFEEKMQKSQRWMNHPFHPNQGHFEVCRHIHSTTAPNVSHKLLWQKIVTILPSKQ